MSNQLFRSTGESFRSVGSIWKNCGASGGQEAALNADMAFQKAVTAQYSQTIGENEGILNDLTSNFEKIFNAGPEQEGMSPAELAVYNSQALNSAAAANKNVQASIGENAAMSSATPGVESGIVQAEKANAATQVENNLSNQQMQITEKNYDLGRQNYETAAKGLMEAPSALENPINETAGTVNNSNKNTADQANENAAANSQWIGLAAGLGKDAASAFKV